MKIAGFFARRRDKRLGADLRENLVRLFTEHSARVVENDEAGYHEPLSFDYAVATVATPDLYLRFVRVRGHFLVDISLGSHQPWNPLDSALLWLNMTQGIQARSDVPTWGYGVDWNSLDWGSIDRFLVEHWDRIKVAELTFGASTKRFLSGESD